MPARLQLRRTKGWRLPAGAINVARPSRWGNPYKVDRFGRDLAIELFRRSLHGIWTIEGIPGALIDEAYGIHLAFIERFGLYPHQVARNELKGRDLACWCRPDEPCHADVLIVTVNQLAATAQ